MSGDAARPWRGRCIFRSAGEFLVCCRPGSESADWMRQLRHRRREDFPERRPQRQDVVVRHQVPAETAVAAIVVGVEFDVLFKEEAEGLLRCAVPVRGAQHRREDAAEPAILVAGDACGASGVIHPPHPVQVDLPDRVEIAAVVDRPQRQQPPHELVMVEPLARPRDPGPRRQIVGAALASVQFAQTQVVGKQAAGDFEVFAELDREEVIGVRNAQDVLVVEALPPHVADVADDLLAGAGVADFRECAAMLGLVGESRKSVHFALAPVDSKVQV